MTGELLASPLLHSGGCPVGQSGNAECGDDGGEKSPHYYRPMVCFFMGKMKRKRARLGMDPHCKDREGERGTRVEVKETKAGERVMQCSVPSRSNDRERRERE